jgi:hypothetical protein
LHQFLPKNLELMPPSAIVQRWQIGKKQIGRISAGWGLSAWLDSADCYGVIVMTSIVPIVQRTSKSGSDCKVTGRKLASPHAQEESAEVVF